VLLVALAGSCHDADGHGADGEAEADAGPWSREYRKFFSARIARKAGRREARGPDTTFLSGKPIPPRISSFVPA
jgi:hypothetical protein